MTDMMSSLGTTRDVLDQADGTVARLLAQPAGPERDRALARALTERARAWRMVAHLSFDDVVAGDLLDRAARQAARHDDLLAQRLRDPAGAQTPS